MDEDRKPGEYRREGLSGKTIAAIVALVVLVVFMLQNRDRANVDFLFWDVDARLWVVIVIAAVLGVVIGWFLGRSRRGRD
ncbi:MAG: lipopolysaccharide assembly protein LapA domain-containing protein [Actinomycetota bacterium]